MSKLDYQRIYSNRRPSMESSSHSSNSPSLFSSGASSTGSSSNHTTPQESPLHPNLSLYGAHPGMAMMSTNNSAKEYQMMLLNNMNGVPPNHSSSSSNSSRASGSKRPAYPPLSGTHSQIPMPRGAPSPSLSSSSSSEYQMPWRPAGKGVGNGPIPPQGPGMNNVRPGRTSFSHAEGEREKEMIRIRMVEQQARDREAQMMRSREQGGHPSAMARSSSTRAGASNGARKPPIAIVPQPPMRSQTPAVMPSSMSINVSRPIPPSTPAPSQHQAPPQQRARTTSLKAPSTPAPPPPKEREEEGEGRVLSEAELRRILRKRDAGDDGVWRCLICGNGGGEGGLDVVRIITEEEEWEKLKSYHLPSHPLLHTSYPSNSLSLCPSCRSGFISYSIILRPLSSSTAQVIALPSPYQARYKDLHNKEVKWNESETWRAVRPFRWAVGFHRNVGERLAKGYLEARKNGESLPQRGKTPAPGGQPDRPKKKVSFAPMPE